MTDEDKKCIYIYIYIHIYDDMLCVMYGEDGRNILIGEDNRIIY